jgi:hypothetical protein
MQISNEARRLIRAIEVHVVGETEEDVNRLAWFPVKFLWMGILEIFRKNLGLVVCAFLLLLIIFPGLIIFPSLPSTNMTSEVIGLSLVSLMFLLFAVRSVAVPSTYGDSGVLPENVKFTVKHLENQKFTTAEKVELLQKSVKPFED